MSRQKIDTKKKRIPMSVAISPSLKANIERLAFLYNKPTSRLVELAIQRLLESNENFNNLLNPKK
jgi:hypothetical protein